MTPRITIAEAARHVGESVQIAGWLYNLRRSGKIAFPILRDGYGLMQCVAVKAALPEELFETVKNLTQESSIIVTGKIRAEQRAPAASRWTWRIWRWCNACRKATRIRSRPRSMAPTF